VKRGERLNGDEAENDAISAYSQVASYPLILHMTKIMQVKDAPPQIAARVALDDVSARFNLSVATSLKENGYPPIPDMAWAAREWLLGHADIQLCGEVASEESERRYCAPERAGQTRIIPKR
jgi:hypothetical protein